MCDYEGCDNPSEFYDKTDNEICEECMEREVDDGGDPEDFERFCMIIQGGQ